MAWGDEEKDKGLSGLLLHKRMMNDKGLTMTGQPLKIKPKGTGNISTTATSPIQTARKATKIPPHSALGRGIKANKPPLANEIVQTGLENTAAITKASADSALLAAQEVGTANLLPLPTTDLGSKVGSNVGMGIGKTGGVDSSIKIAQDSTNIANQQLLSNTTTHANALKDAAGTAAQGTAMTAAQAQAAAIVPWLLGAQVALGFLGSKKDQKESWRGIGAMGNPWGAAGAGGTGFVG